MTRNDNFKPDRHSDFAIGFSGGYDQALTEAAVFAIDRLIKNAETRGRIEDDGPALREARRLITGGEE